MKLEGKIHGAVTLDGNETAIVNEWTKRYASTVSSSPGGKKKGNETRIPWGKKSLDPRLSDESHFVPSSASSDLFPLSEEFLNQTIRLVTIPLSEVHNLLTGRLMERQQNTHMQDQ